jgi:hypothetical protein
MQSKYRAIEGIITFFINQGIGTPESWISYIDGGIVEAIQCGGATCGSVGEQDRRGSRMGDISQEDEGRLVG